MHSIKIENITDSEYERLQQEAIAQQMSIRNYVRLRLYLPPLKRGSPHNNKGRKIKQPPRTKKPPD